MKPLGSSGDKTCLGDEGGWEAALQGGGAARVRLADVCRAHEDRKHAQSMQHW